MDSAQEPHPQHIAVEEDFHPPLAEKSNEVIFKIETTSKAYSDQTGEFPFPSS